MIAQKKDPKKSPKQGPKQGIIRRLIKSMHKSQHSRVLPKVSVSPFSHVCRYADIYAECKGLGCMAAVMVLLAMTLVLRPLHAAEYQVHKLDNGLTLVTSYFSHAPLAMTYVHFKAGAMTETRETTGLTHLLEHLLWRANDVAPDEASLRKLMRSWGAKSNASVSASHFNYYANYPAAYFDEVLELAGAVAQSQQITEELVKNEIPIVLDELERRMVHSWFAYHHTMSRVRYGEKLYNRNLPIGTSRSVIKNATPEQLKGISREVIAPSNTTIFVIGNIPREQAVAGVKKHFGDWRDPAGWTPPKIPRLPEISKTSRHNFSHSRVPNTSIRVNLPAFRPVDAPKDTYTADILSYLVDQNTGKFYKKFIESGKWLSGYYGYYTNNFNPFSFFSATIKTNEVDEVISEAFGEFKLMSESKDYFTVEELKATRNGLAMSFRITGDNMFKYGNSFMHYFVNASPEYYREYLPGLLAVTLEDVRDFIKRRILNQPYAVSVLYSAKDAKEWNVDLNGDAYFNEHLAKNYARAETEASSGQSKKPHDSDS